MFPLWTFADSDNPLSKPPLTINMIEAQKNKVYSFMAVSPRLELAFSNEVEVESDNSLLHLEEL